MSAFMAGVDRWSTRSAAVLGTCAARCLLGFVGFMYYASAWTDRRYLFGPDGVLPHEDFLRERGDDVNLYAVSGSTGWYELVFHACALAALAVALGVGGRVVLALHWLLLWSVYQRQPVLLDGGDNLACVILPMLLLTRCYDRLRLPLGIGERIERRLPGAVRALSAPLHNLGTVAIVAQMCLVYTTSGLYKVMGDVWQDGTALFYIMRVPEYELPGWSHLVYGNDTLVYLGTYTTVLFLVYFPLGVLVPALRPWTALVSIAFHVSIAVFMGLTGFALTMVACDLVLLSPVLERFGRTLLRRRQARRTRSPVASTPADVTGVEARTGS